MDTDLYDRPAVHPAFGKDIHVGRSWNDNFLERDCPCDKGPCGLVVWSGIRKDCDQHALRFSRTLRQVHNADECPGASL